MQEEIDNLKQQIIIMRTDMERLKSELTRQSHNGFDGERIQFDSVTGLIKVVTTSTEFNQMTAADRNVNAPSNQMFVYYNTTGPVWKLYIYDQINKVWKNVTIA